MKYLYILIALVIFTSCRSTRNKTKESFKSDSTVHVKEVSNSNVQIKTETKSEETDTGTIETVTNTKFQIVADSNGVLQSLPVEQTILKKEKKRKRKTENKALQSNKSESKVMESKKKVISSGAKKTVQVEKTSLFPWWIIWLMAGIALISGIVWFIKRKIL